MASRASQMLSTLFDIRAGEGVAMALLVGAAVGKGISILFLNTSANTLFLTRFGVEAVPYTYVVAAPLAALVGIGFARAAARISLLRLVQALVAFLVAVLVGFFVALVVFDSREAVFALMVWKQVHWYILEIGFWATAGFLFTLHQGKRLFAVVAAGDVLARIAGGALVPAALQFWPTEFLLLGAAVGLVGVLTGLALVFRRFPDRFVPSVGTAESRPPALKSLLGRRYIRLMFGFSIVTLIAFCFVEFLFFQQVAQRFNDEVATASFFALFFAVVGVVNLVTSGVVTGRMLTRYGVVLGLTITPVVVAANVLAGVSLLHVAGGVALFFWLSAAAKLAHDVLAESAELVSLRLLYQPIRQGERVMVQALRESVMEPTGMALAGLGLAVLAALQVRDDLIAVLILLVAIPWIGFAWALARSYFQEIRRALEQRRLAGHAPPIFDAESRVVLERALHSNHGAEMTYALRLMEDLGLAGVPDYLRQALDHPSADVRCHAAGRLGALGGPGDGERLAVLIRDDPAPAVCAAAVAALCGLGGALSIAFILDDWDRFDGAVRTAALREILKTGSGGAHDRATERLRAMANSAAADDRADAGTILDSAGGAFADEMVVRLLADEASGVREAALGAAAQMPGERFVPAAIGLLADRENHRSAARALVSRGVAVLTRLDAEYRRPGVDWTVRARIARAVDKLAEPQSTTWLLAHLDEPDPPVRDVIVDRLAYHGAVSTPSQSVAVEAALGRRCGEATALQATVMALAAAPPGPLLDALRADERRIRNQTLVLIAFLDPQFSAHRVAAILDSPRVNDHARAVELVERATPTAFRQTVLSLIERAGDAQPGQSSTGPTREPKPAIMAIIVGTTPGTSHWTRACAVYAAAELGGDQLVRAVADRRGDADDCVAETAAWAVGRMRDDHRRGLPDNRELKAGSMRLTLEKVLILKSVPVFASVPEETLAKLAAITGEIEAEPGQEIIHQNDIGTSVYVIVDGTADVEIDGERIGQLGPRQVFGELAAFDPEPRAATVRATARCELFVIENADLEELTEAHPDVGREFIRLLCRMVRGHNGESSGSSSQSTGR